MEHRYTIYGQVVDESRAPIGNAAVIVTGLGGRPMGKTTIDADGQYSILLHIHDQDLGAQFWVTVNRVTQSGKITFDIANRVADRTHRLDFTLSESS
ncbi:MAG: carboxypeptidase-like regulatory domain-containing protein [Gammaproteobacteria bacterium]|nr:carboxypeptidase-like regulatory domain-containing protein [Gammaproteobacteria bacterium]